MWQIEVDLIIKIILAVCLGGLVGYERESLRRPAGLRTHILVAVGATIVSAVNTMIISDLAGISGVSIAPARYGAAVISGIGFLGAGTIMKEGMSVKGLTTAAGLWAVACIGLVIGHGYYGLAISTSVLVFITLEIFMRLEDRFSFSRRSLKLEIVITDTPGIVGRIGHVLDNENVAMSKISMKNTENPYQTLLLIRVRYTKRTSPAGILDALRAVDGIISVVESPM